MSERNLILVMLVVMTGTGCKEIYKPEVISSPDRYLVVEGNLNPGSDPTHIRLTRTFKLDDSAQLRGENNAQLVVEGKDNTTWSLLPQGDGIYTHNGLNMTIGQEYRLRINTADGNEYVSDFIPARTVPPIDSIGWVRRDDGVQIHVSTHDPSQATRYYRWEFDETWEIHSYYFSEFKYAGGVVSPRMPSERVYTCWKYDFSNKIILGSSASLQTDHIYRAPVTKIINGDERLDVRYSILVRQYALDKAGYEFYELMRKNTESLGSIFDAQPSEQRGNFRCTTNPDELVIGYLTASTVEQQRRFIAAHEIPNGWYFYEDCPEEIVRNHPDSIKLAYDGGGSIWSAVYTPFGSISHYKFSKIECVECTARNGSLQKPPYW